MPLNERSTKISFPFFLFCCVLFLLIVGLLYGRTILFDLTNYIDSLYIFDIRRFVSAGLSWKDFFLKPDILSVFFYRPLLNLSFALDTVLAPNVLWFYHLVNLAIHAISAMFVLLLLKEWGFSRSRALVGALVFLVHPVLVEAVVWIPGRTDSLLGLFCFSGFWAFLRYLRQGRSGDLSIYVVSLAAALLVKETAVILAVMVLFFLVVQKPREWDMARTRVALLTGVLVILWLGARAYALKDARDISIDAGPGTFLRNLPALVLYLGKAFAPVNLSVFPTMWDSRLFYGWITLAVVSGVAFLRRRDFAKSHEQMFRLIWGCAWFILFLLPSLAIGDLRFEYRVYVSLLGAIMVALELLPMLDHQVFVILSAGVIVSFSVISWGYSEAYQNKWNFWQRAASQAPHSALAQKNLGAFYHESGDLKSASEYYRKALALNPEEEMLNNNLGLLCYVDKDYEKATQYFLKEIEYHAWNYLPYYNLSTILFEQRRWDEARQLLEKAMELNPDDVDVCVRLAEVYLEQGHLDGVGKILGRLQRAKVTIPPGLIERAAKSGLALTSL